MIRIRTKLSPAMRRFVEALRVSRQVLAEAVEYDRAVRRFPRIDRDQVLDREILIRRIALAVAIELPIEPVELHPVARFAYEHAKTRRDPERIERVVRRVAELAIENGTWAGDVPIFAIEILLDELPD